LKLKVKEKEKEKEKEAFPAVEKPCFSNGNEKNNSEAE
jgi:hypothetical protein